MDTKEKKLIQLTFKSIFGINDPKILEMLEKTCTIVKKQKDEILFRQYQKGSIIYYLIDGRIKLYRLDEKGNECVVHFVRNNEFFAEILLTQDVYPVNAQMLMDSIMIGIDKNILLSFLKPNPELSLHIIYLFSQRINYLVDTLERLSTQNAKERFLNYLNYLKRTQKSNTIVLDLPKQELALLLGMSKETFSRIEKQLNQEGIICVKNKQIDILKQILP
ncbi:Crp/Fnr family transcriptional regulator [Desulfurella multipotens]|uniref:Crp/Fnr family transcriptional regulator n=1 Tax=Desulfurella multipotens TaxID=79269 RepID=UPI000CC0D41F|nr:Crp/Fnr family transcriptional regulator [Desulfurella multipotens]PMP63415.1 MAG: Crp/Fnr family transcriptional regulator [Desulfurella multipotens]